LQRYCAIQESLNRCCLFFGDTYILYLIKLPD
jgi:hypothetical protein